MMLVAVSSSGHSETLARLLAAIARRDLTVFAQIDHAAAAREVGMELPDEVVVAFGNPRAGTPLMQEDPRVGIELPLRMLVWERAGQTSVGYNDPSTLSDAYNVSSEATLQAMHSLLQTLASEATGGEQNLKPAAPLRESTGGRRPPAKSRILEWPRRRSRNTSRRSRPRRRATRTTAGMSRSTNRPMRATACCGGCAR